MILFVRNRYLDAALKSLLFYAVIHFFLMLLYFLRFGDWTVFNLFSILGFTLFFPTIAVGVLSAVLSWVVLISVFLLIYYRHTQPKK